MFSLEYRFVLQCEPEYVEEETMAYNSNRLFATTGIVFGNFVVLSMFALFILLALVFKVMACMCGYLMRTTDIFEIQKRANS
jgi:hypothetical protein